MFKKVLTSAKNKHIMAVTSKGENLMKVELFKRNHHHGS